MIFTILLVIAVWVTLDVLAERRRQNALSEQFYYYETHDFDD